MKYLFVLSFFVFLLDGCPSFCEYEEVRSGDKRNKYVSDDNNVELVDSIIENGKHFTIINRTDKTYKNNGLYLLEPLKENGVWKLEYCLGNVDHPLLQKISIIKPNKEINKNEKGKILKLKIINNNFSENVFLLYLDGGKRKVFFGAYERAYEIVWKDDNKECKRYFVRFDVHPVWQKKELTIEIYKDRITFSDPKIKEVKKLRLSYDEYADPNTLPLVDCSKE